MKSRPQNRGLSYYRRSDDKQEASLGQQHGCARETADKMGAVFRGTLADVERMQQQSSAITKTFTSTMRSREGICHVPGFSSFLLTRRPTTSRI